jgi:hypothetical protein
MRIRTTIFDYLLRMSNSHLEGSRYAIRYLCTHLTLNSKNTTTTIWNEITKMFSSLFSFFFLIQGVNPAHTKLGRCHAVPTIIPCDNPFNDRRPFPLIQQLQYYLYFLKWPENFVRKSAKPKYNAISNVKMYINIKTYTYSVT